MRLEVRRMRFYVSQYHIAKTQGRKALAEYYANKIRKLAAPSSYWYAKSNKVSL